jgi:peroxiredoxin
LRYGSHVRVLHVVIVATLAGAACSKPAPAPAPASSTNASERDAKAREAAAKLVGTTPPEWKAERWLGSSPLTLAGLRGKVVLVRWWTAGCPFCSATAPSLRTFDKTYGPRGLAVVGMYHHKEETPFDPKVYDDTARKYEFTFPVAFDPEWQTFHAWMRDAGGATVDTGWTSVTFLLDKHGVIRHVHPGGSYVAGEPAYAELEAMIERLLVEPT